MSDKFKYSGMGNTENTGFQAFLAAAMTTLKSTPFVNIDSDELAFYSHLLQYRVQRDLFELWEEAEPGAATWDDFISLMRGTQTLRNMCMDVICKKMTTTSFHFDFNLEDVDLSLDEIMNPEDFIHAAQLFSDNEGIFLISLFLFFAELAHFNHLKETVRANYKWMDYFYDLKHDVKLWKFVLTAFRNTVLQIDFKDIWQEVDFNHES